MYSNFMFLDRLLCELSCKKTHTHIDAHTDSDEYSIVAFCENATIIILQKRHGLVVTLQLFYLQEWGTLAVLCLSLSSGVICSRCPFTVQTKGDVLYVDLNGVKVR